MDSLIKLLFANIGNFSLVILGIEITIFTVIYSFISSKKLYYEEVCELCKFKGTPELQAKRDFAYSYIDKWKGFNNVIVFMIVFSLIIYILSFFTTKGETDIICTIDYFWSGIYSVYILSFIGILSLYIYKYYKE